MKLFLSSYFAGVASVFPAFTNNTCPGKKVVFIPTASIPEKVVFYVSADKRTLAKLGLIIDELDVSSTPYDEMVNRISDADYIFVEGGNTFFLLQELKRSGADKLIIEHINKGKLYIGASAGSMVVSENIEYVKYMDNPAAAPNLNDDFSALSVIDFCIVPHCTNVPFKKAAEKIITVYSDKLDLRPISNNQAITFENGHIEQITVESKKKNN
ncbi:putative peptidase Lmo0363 [Deltaproteobacteria bacterium]|nr:putative peptidase Lmo0363 [Deltaproteobacteria bacterium]